MLNISATQALAAKVKKIDVLQQEVDALKEKNKEQAELPKKQQQQLLELSRKVEQLLRQ